MIRTWKAECERSACAKAAVFFILGLTLLADLCNAQVSGFSPDVHLSSTIERKSAQQLLSDLSAARHWLDSHPCAEANLALGRALKALGESQTPSMFFDRALELNPKLAEAWFEKGLALSDSGDWSNASELFSRALTYSPDYAAAHLALGEMLLRVGNFDAARKEFSNTLQLDSNSAGAHQGMGLVNLQEGRFDLAAAEFRRALAIRPAYSDSETGLARTLAGQHKWDEAAALLRKVVAANPNSSERVSALGTALANTGNKSGAAEQFARARELSNKELNLFRAKGDTNWGVSLRNEGKWHEAETAFRRAIGDDPTFCDAHDDLGEVLWMQKETAGALREFQSAVRCDPDSAMARNNLGSALLYASHDLDSAIEELRAAIARKPGFALAHLNLGKALAAQQDFSAAEAELRIVLVIDPGSAAAHMNLGLVLAAANANLSSEAQSEMEEAVHIDPRLKELIPQQYLARVH